MFLASLAVSAGKFLIGHHIWGGSVNPFPKAESWMIGLGGRFFIGFGSAFYFTNPAFRAGVNACIVAIKDAIL